MKLYRSSQKGLDKPGKYPIIKQASKQASKQVSKVKDNCALFYEGALFHIVVVLPLCA